MKTCESCKYFNNEGIDEKRKAALGSDIIHYKQCKNAKAGDAVLTLARVINIKLEGMPVSGEVESHIFFDGRVHSCKFHEVNDEEKTDE